MDDSAAPWRVLEDPADRATRAGGASATSDEKGDRLPAWITWQAIIGMSVAAVLALGAFVVAATSSTGTVSIEEAGGGRPIKSGLPVTTASGGHVPAGEIVVDVQGAVLRPGVLRLADGARVGDAIQAAGGYAPRVDAERAGRELNLAASLKDGDRVVVPSRDDPPGGAVGSGSGGGSSSGGGGALIDLNSASASELDTLPGIGPVTAQKIIDAREEQPFASVDDLQSRKVVGASTFEKIRELLTVR
jgi:competence protein ComEA